MKSNDICFCYVIITYQEWIMANKKRNQLETLGKCQEGIQAKQVCGSLDDARPFYTRYSHSQMSSTLQVDREHISLNSRAV